MLIFILDLFENNQIKLNHLYLINSCFILINFKIFLTQDLIKLVIQLFIFKINYIYLNTSIIYSIKFVATILFLIFIRAGIPRYRYDYLTILGWNRFFFLSFFILILYIIFYIFL